MSGMYGESIEGGVVGTLLASLIPLIPTGVDLGIKGVKWIVDKIKLEAKLKENGLSVRTVHNTIPYGMMFMQNED